MRVTDFTDPHDDLVDILNALGLGDHARPKSAHEVVQSEILPAIRKLIEDFGGFVEASCDEGHQVMVDDGEGTTYACPVCALRAARADLETATVDIEQLRELYARQGEELDEAQRAIEEGGYA